MLLVLAVLLTVFGLGVRLFQLRFEAGDVYPPYSSLRSDPLGTKVFFQSLINLRGPAVQRFLQRLNQLPEGRDTTLFVFGADSSEMNHSTAEEYTRLEQFMFEGGRIVNSFAPLNTRPWAARREEARREKEQKTSETSDQDTGNSVGPDKKGSRKKRRPINENKEAPGGKLISLKERWNVNFGYEDLPKDADEKYQTVQARSKVDGNLPESVVWHTALYFERPSTNWNVIYARDTRPVLIERRFGRGALVLSADSYFLSNEAIRNERQADLLAWLVGSNANVLFDETHLGVLESPGVATLVRKYRLEGVVLGLVVLVGLFVWKNASSFVPAHQENSADTLTPAVAGKESAVGFVNLLRRSIAPSELASVCFTEWRKSRPPGRADLDAKIGRVAAVMAEEQARPAPERNPIEMHCRISRMMAERK